MSLNSNRNSRILSFLYIGCVSESGDFADCFFLVRQHWGGFRYRHFAANFKVAMGPWTGAQSVFAVKVFYKNGDSFVIAQREFRREFGIYRNRAVPSAHAIKTWVWNLEAAGSTLKKKGGSVISVEHWLQTARVTQSSNAQNGVDSGFF